MDMENIQLCSCAQKKYVPSELAHYRIKCMNPNIFFYMTLAPLLITAVSEIITLITVRLTQIDIKMSQAVFCISHNMYYSNKQSTSFLAGFSYIHIAEIFYEINHLLELKAKQGQTAILSQAVVWACLMCALQL